MKVLVKGYDPAPFLKVLQAREAQRKLPPAESITPMTCHLPRTAWQKVWTLPAGSIWTSSLWANTTPLVHIVAEITPRFFLKPGTAVIGTGEAIRIHLLLTRYAPQQVSREQYAQLQKLLVEEAPAVWPMTASWWIWLLDVSHVPTRSWSASRLVCTRSVA